MGDRVILHSDINCCYASIEHLHHPELAGKPLAVGGDPEARHGIVLTADYIAKKYGVKTGMALWQARQVCPDKHLFHQEWTYIFDSQEWHMRYMQNIRTGRSHMELMSVGLM